MSRAAGTQTGTVLRRHRLKTGAAVFHRSSTDQRWSPPEQKVASSHEVSFIEVIMVDLYVILINRCNLLVLIQDAKDLSNVTVPFEVAKIIYLGENCLSVIVLLIVLLVVVFRTVS